MTLNLYSQIGLVMLVGLAAKNGILIVEFANQLRDAGRPFHDALYEAAGVRLRPIVMTSLAFGFGVLPLALASGAGAGAQRAIGIGVLGGVVTSTFLVTVFAPLFYVTVYRALGKHRARERTGGIEKSMSGGR